MALAKLFVPIWPLFDDWLGRVYHPIAWYLLYAFNSQLLTFESASVGAYSKVHHGKIWLTPFCNAQSKKAHGSINEELAIKYGHDHEVQVSGAVFMSMTQNCQQKLLKWMWYLSSTDAQSVWPVTDYPPKNQRQWSWPLTDGQKSLSIETSQDAAWASVRELC